MRFIRWGVCLGTWLLAQDLPYEALYFQGKLKAFARRVHAAYRKEAKRKSFQDPTFLATGVAYALSLTEAGQHLEADSLLRQFIPLLDQASTLPASLRFRYYWVAARAQRGRGYTLSAYQALQGAARYAQAPWETLLLAAETAELQLLWGNASSALDTLSASPIPSQLQEPYQTYLRDRYGFLRLMALWQVGAWDSLPPRYPQAKPSDHLFSYQATYAYLLARAALLRGESRIAQTYLRQSARSARKTFSKGLDLQLRAQSLAFLIELQYSKPASYGRRLRKLSPLIKLLRSSELPVTYATVEALENLVRASLLVRRALLAENLLGLFVTRAEGLVAARLQRVAAGLARAEYRPSLAIGYAMQAARRTASQVPSLALEEALAQAELGESALLGYQYTQADSAFARAAQVLAALGEPRGPLTFAVREAMGRRALQAGQYAQAEQVLRYQHDTYRKLLRQPDKNADYLRLNLFLADLYIRLSQAALADSLLRSIQGPIEDLPPVYWAERILLEELLGDVAQLRGQFREAERHYMEAVRLRSRQRKAGLADVEESGSLLRLALLYQRTGRLTRAREVYQKLTTLYQNSGRKDPEVASYYVGLADFYLLAGDYLKAEEAAQKARGLTQEVQGTSSPAYVEALLVSARIEGALGRYDKQQQYLREALAAQQRFYAGKPSVHLGRTWYLLAENALSQGKRDSAAFYLATATQEAERAQSAAPLEYAALSLDIGAIALALDSLDLAEARIASAKAILQAQVPLRHPDRMRAFLYEARLERARGQYIPALMDFKRWLSLWSQVYGTQHPEYPFYLAEMADSYWLARDVSSAKKAYEKAVSRILTQVDKLFNGLSENEKARYWARVRTVLEHYFAFAFSEGIESSQVKAYEVYLATKALLLSETGQLRARLARSRDTTVQRLFREWQDQKEYVVRLYAYSPAELKELGINLAEEEVRLNALEKELTAYVGDIRLRRPTWKQLKKALPPDAAAIDWIRLRVPLKPDSVVYYAVVTLASSKKPLIVVYPDGKRLEKYAFFRYAQSILNFERDTTSYAVYWAPVAEKLPKDVQKLWVSGDGVYYQINLSTIPLPQGGYVVDRYQVVYYSRLASLVQPPKPIRYYEGRKALLIADPDYAAGISPDSVYVPPLPGTAEEARAIRDILQSEGILAYVRTRAQAEETILYETTSPYILHIATHGVFLPYDEGLGSLVGIQSGSALLNPLFRSALLLAQSGRSMVYGASDVSRDGIANAYELLNLDLSNTQLVALSACETGLGDVQNGEGVYGLQRAFLLAGARNLLLSLWRVDDEATRDFMIHFYSEWFRKKLPIEEAFWNTQRAMRAQRSAPYFWGAFVLVRP